MAEYVYIQNYANHGDLGISRYVFEEIVSLITNKVQGAKLKENSDKFIFTFHKPVRCEIKENKVIVKIDVNISKDAIVANVCKRIQDEIANAFNQMVEIVPFQINIKVTGIF